MQMLGNLVSAFKHLTLITVLRIPDKDLGNVGLCGMRYARTH